MMSDFQDLNRNETALDISPQELVEKFDSYLAAQNKSDGTRRIYTYMLAKFFNWLGDIPWYRVHTADVIRWRDDLMEKYKPLTVSTHLAAVRSFYEYMLGEGVLNSNPFFRVKSPKGTHKTVQILTRQEWLALLASCDGNSPSDIRDRAILVLAYELGLRGSEILTIDLADFDNLLGKRILFVQTRGDHEKQDYMVIPEHVGAVLDDWLTVRGSAPGPLFNGLIGKEKGARLSTSRLYALWGDRKKAARITGDRKTFHSLRQTAIHRRARYAVEHGKSIYLVQAFARHKSPKATLPYFPEIDKAQDPPELWDLDPEEDLSSE